jgi:hypothetical protein
LIVVRLQLNLIERTVFAVGVPNGALPRIPAAEDGDLAALAVVKQLLDAPIADVLAIPE